MCVWLTLQSNGGHCEIQVTGWGVLAVVMRVPDAREAFFLAEGLADLKSMLRRVRSLVNAGRRSWYFAAIVHHGILQS